MSRDEVGWHGERHRERPESRDWTAFGHILWTVEHYTDDTFQKAVQGLENAESYLIGRAGKKPIGTMASAAAAAETDRERREHEAQTAAANSETNSLRHENELWRGEKDINPFETEAEQPVASKDSLWRGNWPGDRNANRGQVNE